MNIAKFLKIKSAFSLMEMVVVVIVISVLASLAVPRYMIATERVKSAEGVQILTTLLAAQKRYALEHSGSYKTGTGGGACTATLQDGDLDVNIPSPKYFDSPCVFQYPTYTYPATIVRQGSYTLSIDINGNIHCSGGAGSTCTKMGYNP